MRSYERILQFRCLAPGPASYLYELVEIPKTLLMEALLRSLLPKQAAVRLPSRVMGMFTTKIGD